MFYLSFRKFNKRQSKFDNVRSVILIFGQLSLNIKITERTLVHENRW